METEVGNLLVTSGDDKMIIWDGVKQGNLVLAEASPGSGWKELCRVNGVLRRAITNKGIRTLLSPAAESSVGTWKGILCVCQCGEITREIPAWPAGGLAQGSSNRGPDLQTKLLYGSLRPFAVIAEPGIEDLAVAANDVGHRIGSQIGQDFIWAMARLAAGAHPQPSASCHHEEAPVLFIPVHAIDGPFFNEKPGFNKEQIRIRQCLQTAIVLGLHSTLNDREKWWFMGCGCHCSPCPERERLADDFVQFLLLRAAAEGERAGEVLPISNDRPYSSRAMKTSSAARSFTSRGSFKSFAADAASFFLCATRAVGFELIDIEHVDRRGHLAAAVMI